MHEDLDIPGPAELEQLADNEAGEGRMPNCQHFRRLARKWREDREDRDALRHALLQATTEKARARRVELKPSAERMAYAVALQGDHGITLAPLCKAPACAVQALSPFEGAPVVGLATIAMEREAISGMQYRLKHAGVAPQQASAPVGVEDGAMRKALVNLVHAGKRFRNTVVETRGVLGMDEHDLAISAAEAALAQQPAAVGDDADPAEPCESGLSDCGPAVAWDSDGVGACDRCAKELGWIPGPQQGGQSG